MRVSDGRLSVLKSMYKFGVYSGVELVALCDWLGLPIDSFVRREKQ